MYVDGDVFRVRCTEANEGDDDASIITQTNLESISDTSIQIKTFSKNHTYLYVAVGR